MELENGLKEGKCTYPRTETREFSDVEPGLFKGGVTWDEHIEGTETVFNLW